MILHVGPLLSILFGILILIFPRFLNYLVALYLILTGLVGLGVVVFRQNARHSLSLSSSFAHSSSIFRFRRRRT